MPNNTSIPSHSTGQVLAAGDWNTLVPLNTGIGILGGSNAITGSLEPATAPNYQIQAGLLSVTFSSGLSSTYNFPAAFPNGLLSMFFLCCTAGLRQVLASI